MKKLFSLLFLFMTFSLVYSQTIIDSDVTTNTTWTIANSPYIVTSPITIEPNITLTIEPGVVIKAPNSQDLMWVDGTLIANGTISEPIIFTSISDDAYGGDSNNDGTATVPEAGDWRSIWVREGSANSSNFQHCLIRFAGYASSAAIFADGCSPQVTDCHFQNCNYGMEINGAVSPVVQNNLFEGIVKLSVIISPGSNPVFSGNIFSNVGYTGLGLSDNRHGLAGDNDTLKKINLAGITNIPYILEHWLTIAPNTRLTIEPGLVIKAPNSQDLMWVDGTLIANGTISEPIIFTSIYDDSYGGDSNNDGTASVPEAGDWRKIWVREGSANSSNFQHCLIRFAGYASSAAIFADGCSPQVTDCHFQNCNYGMEINGAVSPVVQNNLFEGIAKLPVIISPGSNPVFSGNIFSNVGYTGLGLSDNRHVLAGDSDTLKKINLAGITNIPYILEHWLTIEPNTTLTIEPGVVLKATTNNDLVWVDGTLIANGKPSEPIIFTSISDDAYGGDSNNDGTATVPEAGDWRRIWVREGSANSSNFQHCLIRFAGYGSNAAIFADGSSPTITHTKIENSKIGIEVSNQTGLVLNNIEFSNTQTGLLIQIDNGIVQVDSSRFFQNEEGIVISKGNAIINNSELYDNTQYDISNNTLNAIDATHNWWGYNSLIEQLQGENPKNLKFLFDFSDNSAYGIIDYSHFIIPSDEIFLVDPNIGVKILDTASVTITANPVLPTSKVVFYNASNGVWTPDSITFIDTLRIKTFWDFAKSQKGKYDVVLINGTDSIKQKDGFSLVESETPFDKWVKFEVNNDSLFTSSVVLPSSQRMHCFIKKATHIGYSSTWKGGIKIFKNNELIASHEKSSEDIELLLENVSDGYYTFEISSEHLDFWNGSIKFCLDPDTLVVNEWGQGKILRPYGNDWKVFEITDNYTELSLQTQGYGLWSQIIVYYEYIGNKDQRWFFANDYAGYKINGVIKNPPKGKYYIKYMDSAVLWDGKSYSTDQSRDYLIFVGTSGIDPEPQQDISVIKLSSLSFGQDYSTLEITGKGLSENIFVQLFNNKDTIRPSQLVYNSDLSKLIVDFDFSLADTGNYYLNLRNDSSDYVHDKLISVVPDQWKPIGIQIIGNEKYRVGRHQTVILKISNNSNSNIKNGYVFADFDNPNISINVESELYEPQFNDYINSLYEKYHIGKQYFFYSNLPPQQSIYIKLKMFSQESNEIPIKLSVSSGTLTDEVYANIFSLFTNVDREILDTISLDPSFRDSINAMSSNQWDEINDLVADYLGLNHFNYDENYTLKNSTISLNNQDNSSNSTQTSRQTKTIVHWTLGITGALSDGITGVASGVATGALPSGFDLVFGGPPAMLEAGFGKLLDVADNVNGALAGMGQGNNSKKEQKSHELTWFVWVKSSTPEDKYGPVGASVLVNDSISNHYIDSSAVFDYRIDYWNKETATAPAAIVYVRDTLDTDFNLSTFNFTEVGFLKWTAKLEGGQYFNINIDTRPDMPYIVNIEGTINPNTREAYWVHTTLDTLTMQLTEDPLGGYLPPIDSTGYQVGWVSYTVESNKDLPDSTIFTNQAFVNFDGVGPWGPAPKEGPFTNIFDFSKPLSKVNQGVAQSTIDSVLISWSGTDAGSGIQDFTIYVSDSSAYEIWMRDTKDTSAWFHGEKGKTYNFFSIARDRVGNVEEKNNVSEFAVYFVLTDISEIENSGNLFRIFPNPSAGLFTLENIFNAVSVQVEIFNLLGKKIYSGVMNEQKKLLDLSKEPNGMYILLLNSNEYVFSKKIIKK